MARDLELALRIRADMAAAETKVRHFRDELKSLLGAGDEAGAGADTASQGLDEVSASADTAAAAVARANAALAASGEAGGMGAAVASANEMVAATAERTTASITRMGEVLGRSHVRVIATIKDFDILDRIQRETAASAADIAEQEAALDRMMAGGLISRGEQARALEKLTELEVAQTAALDANTGAAVANRRAHGGGSRMYMSEHGPRIGLFSMLTRAGAWLITPVGIAVSALAVALGSFAAAAVIGEEEQQRLNKTLELSGGILGITRSQFEQMATEMATGSTSITRAQKALMAVAHTGRFAGREMETVARGAAAMAALTGESVKAAAESFAKAGQDPAKWAAAANQQYHFLTASVYDHIAALQKEGAAQAAARVGANKLSAAMQARYDRVRGQETGIILWLHAEASMWSRLWGAMKGATTPDTLQQKLDAVNQLVQATAKALGHLKVGAVVSNGFEFSRATAGDIERERKRLHALGVEQAALANKIVAAQRKARGTAGLQSETAGYIAAARDVQALNTQLDHESRLKAQLAKLAHDRAAAEALAGNAHAKPADRAAARALIPQIDKDSAALRAQNTSAAQKLIAALKTESANYGLTREQVQLLTLAKDHASAVDIKAARALIHTIAAKKAAAQASEAQAQMLTQERARVSRIAQSLTGAADATAKFRAEQMQLDIALESSAITMKRYTALFLALQQAQGAAQARATLTAEHQQVQRLMADEARAEQNIQAEQQAGLLTEYTARARILALHRQTADQIQRMLPDLERLTRLLHSPQDVETLKNIEAQFVRLHLQVNQLTQALEQGFTQGLEQAFQGLLTGTMTLGQAWRELLGSVLSSIAQIAARALAAKAIIGIRSLLHMGDPSNVGEGAGKLAGASVSLMLGSEMFGVNAGQLQAAADALLVANTMSIAGSSGYAAGGHVAGLGRGDTVPALLTPGEFVVRAPIVQQIGVGFLHALNGGTLPRTGHFSSGGAVGLVRSGTVQIENVTRRSGGLHISVPVTVDSSGAERLDPQKGKQLGRALKVAVQAVIANEQRPGGLLYQPS
jgi:phage-related minor tail protein